LRFTASISDSNEEDEGAAAAFLGGDTQVRLNDVLGP
jgi:hypothetical protein